MKNFYRQASVFVVFLFLAEFISAQEERRLNLKTYPSNLTLEQDYDAVFDCRDEGPLRAQVQWLRGKHVQESHRGRLIVRHVQVRHAGTYTCRAVGFSKTFPGAQVTVRLQVLKYGASTACSPLEAQCRNGDCVPNEFVCDGEFDCSDGSDELHCLPRTPVATGGTLRTWTPSVAELRAPAACSELEGQCRDGRCIALKLFCDGRADCADASDELHCNKTTGRTRDRHHVTPQTGKTRDDSAANRVVRPSPDRWGEWSPWSGCNRQCERTRDRECGAARLADCEGETRERLKCPMKDCQVDGSWSSWTAWTSCSTSCGRGTRRRYRKCDSPAPDYGGAYCRGSDGQQENCALAACAGRGQWGPWGSWSTCSRGLNGTRTRRRVCEAGGSDCRGVDTQNTACSPCPRNLKIGMKPVRLTVSRGRLVNFTCHYRRRGDEPLTLELDLPPVTHSNEVIKGVASHHVIKDSLTATRCGARRRWTLMLGGEHSLVRCVVRDSEGRVLGKAESKVLSVPPNSLLCHGDKTCQQVVAPKKSWKTKLSSPSRYTKEDETKKETQQKSPPPRPPGTLRVQPSFQFVRVGGSAQFVCTASGDPPLVVQWHADGRPLSPRALANGGVLHLTSIRPADAGRYVCTVRNGAGVANKHATVVVIS